jgi:hypothetical protein
LLNFQNHDHIGYNFVRWADEHMLITVHERMLICSSCMSVWTHAHNFSWAHTCACSSAHKTRLGPMARRLGVHSSCFAISICTRPNHAGLYTCSHRHPHHVGFPHSKVTFSSIHSSITRSVIDRCWVDIGSMWGRC